MSSPLAVPGLPVPGLMGSVPVSPVAVGGGGQDGGYQQNPHEPNTEVIQQFQNILLTELCRTGGRVNKLLGGRFHHSPWPDSRS